MAHKRGSVYRLLVRSVTMLGLGGGVVAVGILLHTVLQDVVATLIVVLTLLVVSLGVFWLPLQAHSRGPRS